MMARTITTYEGLIMDEAKRPFLTARDREYLDALFAELTDRHALTPDLASASVRGVADALHRKRMCGAAADPSPLFWYASLPEHAVAVAALATAPRERWSPSFAALALLATVAGALGARIALALVFRHLTPLRISGPDLALVATVMGVVLLAARVRRATRLLQGAGIAGVLALGAVLGVALGRVLRSLGIDGTLVVLPFWLAVLVVVICGAALWLLSTPRDEIIAVS